MAANGNPKLRIKILKSENISNTSIEQGNMLFDKDNGDMYFDITGDIYGEDGEIQVHGNRVLISSPRWTEII